MKFLSAFLLLVLLHAVAAAPCDQARKTVTIEITPASVGTSFPTQNLNRGDFVRWINRRDATIVVTSVDTPRVFESQPLAKDQVFVFEFTQGGVFNYWLLFEANTISQVNVVDCDPFTNTVNPSPSQIVSLSPSRAPSVPVTPSSSPSPPRPSQSALRSSPSPSPSAQDICVNNEPTNEIPIPAGGGVPIFTLEGTNLAPGQTSRQTFTPLATEDVRLTVSATGPIDFAVSNDPDEPWANPVCSWSTTNCILSGQTFTLRCRTPFIDFQAGTLPPRITWYAFARNRADREVRVFARFLNVLREQKAPVTNTLTFENMAGTASVNLN